ncbi:hypothetical protein AX16_004580 [Volvariella volvacea WC 439]|nr:hypothetical protein AX16_004580 [Volvariella volvacea WC 439]
MDSKYQENPDLSPTSPGEDSDAALSPAPDPEPNPGVDGVPVRWYDADRSERYTHITPFQEKHDTSVEFFYKPLTLSALFVGFVVLAYVATTQDVLEEGRDKRRVGVYAAIASFLLFSMIQFRDGPFIRPHPAFWRIILGINLLYELALVFLLFQDLKTARSMMTFLDPSLGRPLPEKSYAENCELTPQNIWNAIDIFCLAHALGWFGKAMILRDYWFCWILSIAFELAEYSLQHQLPNFAECWWDHWILDVLICNWLGTYLGMKTCQYLEVKPYEWRGLRQSRGIRSKARRVLSQFSPHDFTAFKWGTASSFVHYISVVLLLAVFLAAELNPFYLKSLLWLEPDHPIIILRLAFVFLCALPAVRELYQYINDPRKAVRMGQHVWLLLATIATELLAITKWGKGQYPAPLPKAVKWGWIMGATLLTIYPIIQIKDLIMPRAEVGTPKYVANKMKSKGLQRLRWYCQVCQKQCRDENGFKCHAQSESHLRQMLVVGENAGAHISNFSAEFQSEFVKLLSRRFGTKRVQANRVYQEYIADKSHLHMNATRWVTLTEFVKHLGRTGVAKVDETEKGWFIAWIDNSPKALAKAEASLKKERATTSDEQRERMLIAEQIERANADLDTNAPSSSGSAEPEEVGLKREEGEKVVISLGPKPSASASTSEDSNSAGASAGPSKTGVSVSTVGGGGLKLNPLKPAVNPLKVNPLKRPNPLKAGPSSTSGAQGSSVDAGKNASAGGNEKKRPASAMSVAERLILEDQERKRRKMERDNRD